MKNLLWLAILLPSIAFGQVNGSIQKTAATDIIRYYNATAGIDTLPPVRLTGITNGMTLIYNSTTKKWHATAVATADSTVFRTVANSRSLAQTQTALNLKANLISPTFTGALTLATNSLSSSTNHLYQAIDDDYFKQYAYASVADRGEWVFEAGDNGVPWGANGERWRYSYIAGSNGTAKDVLLIDYNDITTPNALTALSFSGAGTGLTGTAASLTAGTVTTNANLTGVVTSIGNATSIADAALSIGKTSGLQTALDGKLNLTGGTLTGALTGTTATFGGNIGIGVTPSAWASGFTVLQVENASFWSTGDDASITANAYFDGTNYKYITTAGATKVYHDTDGSINWATSPLGTAGNTITFTERLRIAQTGAITVSTAPTTSAGTYDILTRNTSTGVVEKIASNTATSGKYTPTYANVANTTSVSSGGDSFYQRIGNIATVRGFVTFQTVLSGIGSTISVNLPVASNFTTTVDAFGDGPPPEASTVATSSANIVADAASNLAYIQFISLLATTNGSFMYSFSYEIK